MLRQLAQYAFDNAAAIGTFTGAMIAAFQSRRNGGHLKRLRTTEHRNANVLGVVVMNLSIMRDALEKIKPGCVDGWREIKDAEAKR